jgi:hypothetical protein
VSGNGRMPRDLGGMCLLTGPVAARVPAESITQYLLQRFSILPMRIEPFGLALTGGLALWFPACTVMPQRRHSGEQVPRSAPDPKRRLKRA